MVERHFIRSQERLSLRGIIREVEQVNAENCPVCGLPRRSELDEYCVEHTTALNSVVNGYEAWSQAYGNIGREEYLTKLAKLAETGVCVIQVAVFLSTNPSRWPS